MYMYIYLYIIYMYMYILYLYNYLAGSCDLWSIETSDVTELQITYCTLIISIQRTIVIRIS